MLKSISCSPYQWNPDKSCFDIISIKSPSCAYWTKTLSCLFLFIFSFENLIANISLYALSWLNWILDAISPLKSSFMLYFNGKTNNFFLDCWIFFTRDKCNCLYEYFGGSDVTNVSPLHLESVYHQLHPQNDLQETSKQLQAWLTFNKKLFLKQCRFQIFSSKLQHDCTDWRGWE